MFAIGNVVVPRDAATDKSVKEHHNPWDCDCPDCQEVIPSAHHSEATFHLLGHHQPGPSPR